MHNNNEHEVILENYKTFYAIAHQNYCTVQRLVKERSHRTNGREIDDDDVNFICEKNAAIGRSSMVTVIFSALTLEAFINHYGIDKFSRNFFDKYLDRLETVSKWVVVPKLAKVQGLDTGGQSFEKLKKLFALRNHLVHFKTVKKKVKDLSEKDWLWEEDANQAIQCVQCLMSEINKLDNTLDKNWMEEAETDPYV